MPRYLVKFNVYFKGQIEVSAESEDEAVEEIINRTSLTELMMYKEEPQIEVDYVEEQPPGREE